MLQIEPLGPYYMKESKLKLKDANRDRPSLQHHCKAMTSQTFHHKDKPLGQDHSRDKT